MNKHWIQNGRLTVWCALCLPLLGGCFGGDKITCDEKVEPYMSARNNALIKVPDGMTQPNRSEALAIPDTKPVHRSGTSCLDEPPSYFRASGTNARSPEEVVASWAQAWTNREADAVIALYSTSFK